MSKIIFLARANLFPASHKPPHKKSVHLAYTRAGVRLRQQPYSFARSASPCGAFLFNKKRRFLLNKKPRK